MTATAIFFNGRRLNIPQAVTEIDATALAAVAPTSVGIVALVGTAEGGVPLSVEESDSDVTQPNTLQRRYRSGDLRTAGIFAFEPSADEAVPGGAQREILVKVNPATAAGVSLPDDNGTDALDITSKDYGQFTEQVSVEVAAGTLNGLRYTIVFEDTVETFDNVGGEAVMDLVYDPGANGYDTAIGTVSASALTVAATKADTGLAAERAADIPAPGVVSIVSDAAGDTQVATVWGLSGGAVVSEQVTLTGLVAAVGTTSFDKVLAARLSSPAVGNITISDNPVTTTLFSFAPADVEKGIRAVSNAPVGGSNLVTVAIDVDTAVDVVLVGQAPAGAVVRERFDMTAGATTPVVGATQFGLITDVILGDVAGARTITLSLTAAQTLHGTFSTVAQAVDRFNAIVGFTANAEVSNFTSYLMTDLDYHQAPARPAPSVHTTAGEFFGDLAEAAATLTAQSQFVNAARATGGQLPPAQTGAQVFLTGGSEGTPTIAEWQTAFQLLEKRRYNILVPLSRDPAVHALALSHLIRKNGVLKSEANGYVGIAKADGSGETRTELQSQIQALNTRHLSAISQEVNKFDPLTGEATWYPPHMLAAVAAGCQAGSAIAEPLTRKTIIANGIRNDSSWSVEEDASALIDRGLMLYEKVDGAGIRCMRSITTHLADSKLAFVEMSSNESLTTFVFEFREALEKKIGGRGLGRTVGSIKSLGTDIADRLVDEEKIVAWRALQVDQVGDVFPVSIEVALVNPINFIPITVHLTPTVAQAA